MTLFADTCLATTASAFFSEPEHRALAVATPLVRLSLHAVAELWEFRVRASPCERFQRGNDYRVPECRLSFLSWLCFQFFQHKKSKSHFTSSLGGDKASGLYLKITGLSLVSTGYLLMFNLSLPTAHDL